MVGCECKLDSKKIRYDQIPVHTFPMPDSSRSIEVIAVAGGLAGMSAAIHFGSRTIDASGLPSVTVDPQNQY
jgi:hypothetical protein